MTVKAIPDGFHTLTPHISVRDCAKAIEFYKKAFGAEELYRLPGPGGQGVVHAEIKFGDSILMLADESPQMGNKSAETVGCSPMGLMIYTNDVDALFDRAVKAGCTPKMPVSDMFWGDRMGNVVDPYGYQWSLGTHKEDLSPEEITKRGEKFYAQMAQQQQK